jgi:hypothetical protein
MDPGFVVDRVRSSTGSLNRRTRIHRGNRRTPPPGVTPAAYCDGRDGCDE